MQDSESARDPLELRRAVARAALAVEGVAAAPERLVRISAASDGLVVHCTLTAYPDVELVVVGAAVQLAVAAALRQHAGLSVREVNVAIDAIAERRALAGQSGKS